MIDNNINILYQAVLDSDSQHFFILLKNYVDAIEQTEKFLVFKHHLQRAKKEDSKKIDKIKSEIEKISITVYNILRKTKNNRKFETLLDRMKINLKKARLFMNQAPLLRVTKEILGFADKNEIVQKGVFLKKINELEMKRVSAIVDYEKQKLFSLWYQWDILSNVKNLDENYEKVEGNGHLEISISENEIMDIIRGERELSKKVKFKFLTALKRIHFAFQEFKYGIWERLSTLWEEYGRISKDKNFFFKIRVFMRVYDPVLLDIMAVLALIYLLLVSLVFVFIPGDILTRNLGRLGINFKDYSFYIAYASLLFLIVILLLLINHYFLRKSKLRIFGKRFLNPYFLLALAAIFSLFPFSIGLINNEYGGPFPIIGTLNQTIEFKNLNLSWTALRYITNVECNSDEPFLIQNHKLHCSLRLDFRNSSNLTLDHFKLCTTYYDENDNASHCDVSGILNESTNRYTIISKYNKTGEFRSILYVNYFDRNTDNLITGYTSEYRGEVITLQEFKNMTYEKLALIFAVCSLLIFSILSASVNLKKLTSIDKENL